MGPQKGESVKSRSLKCGDFMGPGRWGIASVMGIQMEDPSNDIAYEKPKKKSLNLCQSPRDLVFVVLKKEYACKKGLFVVNWAKISN